jgi:hAT family C-terminal dimerisation region
VLTSEHILHAIVNQRDFMSTVNTIVHKAECERIKGTIDNSKFRDLLIKSLAILKPIDALIVKYQSDAVPVSDVLPDFHQLPKQFEEQARELLYDEELNYLVALCKNRFRFQYGDAQGLSYLLDPLYIGHSLSQESRRQVLTSTFLDGTMPTSDEHKKDVLVQCDEYRISATKEKQENSIWFQLLSSWPKTPLQYWLSDGSEWPLLQKLAIKLFILATSSVASERNFSTFVFIHSKMRNSLGHEKVKKLVYIKTNYGAVADVVRPCESDDDSDADSPFPVDSD